MLCVCSTVVIAQPFSVGKRTLTFVDENRSNRSIGTDIYYPATTSGNNTPVASATTGFPVVVFGHGFLIGISSYEWLADSLAKNGYVVALPSTEGSITPSHGDFGKDLSVVCSKLLQFNEDATSVFYGKLLKRAAVGGHSMGGGASFLAAASGNPDINALFNFSAAETNPSAITAALSVTVPTLIISGSRDCIVPPATQLDMYNNLPASICKAYVNLTNVLHCQFANNNFTCATGQILTGCNSSPLNPSQVFGRTISLLLPFLNNRLKESCADEILFKDNFDDVQGSNKLFACSSLPSCGVLPIKLLFFKAVQDKETNLLSWKTDVNLDLQKFVIEKSANGIDFLPLISMPAGQSSTSTTNSYTTVDNYPFSGNNYYRLKIVDMNNNFFYSDIKKVLSPESSFSVAGIFPNPVSDKFQLQLSAQKSVEVQVQIIDLTGIEIVKKKYPVPQGNSTINFDTKNFASGIYILKISSDKGEINRTFKLVKI